MPNKIYKSLLIAFQNADLETIDALLIRLNNSEKEKQILLEFADSLDRDVQSFVYSKLYDYDGNDVIQAAVKGLQNEDEIVRISAIEIIGKQQVFEQLPALINSLTDSDELVRCYAAETIAFLGTDLKDQLVMQAKAEQDEVARTGLYYALYSLGATEYLTALLELLDSESHVVVIRTVNHLVDIMNAANKDAILSALHNLNKRELPVSIKEVLNEYLD
ncbi:HEAT repeat domain-containing protein [Listeria booriae]|uniref:HEAT repeat domain-containing protein n=1 Tax=Listeria booriae TaxID=1552123 RepID=A0A7X0YKK3_9LIST|nr:HEAT repeat domain-containing protein [Listeria booriae]MBC2116186.1 HEAT repeat domain-containing protein [Listeria booriae]